MRSTAPPISTKPPPSTPPPASKASPTAPPPPSSRSFGPTWLAPGPVFEPRSCSPSLGTGFVFFLAWVRVPQILPLKRGLLVSFLYVRLGQNSPRSRVEPPTTPPAHLSRHAHLEFVRHGRRCPARRLAYQEVCVLRHHHVP